MATTEKTIPTSKSALRSMGLKDLIGAGVSLSIAGAEEMTKSKLIDAILDAQSKTVVSTTPPEQEPETGEGETSTEKPTEVEAPVAEKPKRGRPKAEGKEVTVPAAAKEKPAKEDKVLTIPGTPKWLTQMTTWVYVIFPQGKEGAHVTTTALKRGFGAAAEHAKVEPRESIYEVFANDLKENGVATLTAAEDVEGAVDVLVYRMQAI